MPNLTYRQLWSELSAVPRLPPNLAQTFIQRSWQDVRDYRLWSFLTAYGYIVTPNVITAGTVTATQGANTVVFDATAATALNLVALANPPLASPTLGIGRQFRLNSSNSGTPGPIYSIVAWDGTNTATLERPYLEASSSGSTYMVYKAYYAPPYLLSGATVDGSSTTIDFLRYDSISSNQNGYAIRYRKLFKNQQILDGIDPYRGALGTPYVLANYVSNPFTDSGYVAGEQQWPVHEWYPHAQTFYTFKCIYQRRMTELSNLQYLPSTFPYQAVIENAYMKAGQWALGNVAIFPELQGTNWVQFIMMKEKMYKEALIQAIKQDDEIQPQLPFTQGSQFDFPLGGNFLAGHDVSSLVGGGFA